MFYENVGLDHLEKAIGSLSHGKREEVRIESKYYYTHLMSIFYDRKRLKDAVRSIYGEENYPEENEGCIGGSTYSLRYPGNFIFEYHIPLYTFSRDLCELHHATIPIICNFLDVDYCHEEVESFSRRSLDKAKTEGMLFSSSRREATRRLPLLREVLSEIKLLIENQDDYIFWNAIHEVVTFEKRFYEAMLGL